MTPDPELVTLRVEVRELCAAWRAAGRYVPRSDAWMRSFDRDFSRELAARGLLGMTWPVEHGGGGRRSVARLVVTEELLRAGAPVAAHWIADRQIGPAILRHGTRELQDEILPQIVAGEVVCSLGMSESEAGSDLAAVRTTATRVEGGWRIDGRKAWTGGAHLATHGYLLARTGAGGGKHAGLTEFIVDMDTPGIAVSAVWDLAGTHRFNDVTYDGVFVPDHRVLGAVGEGWRQVVGQLAFERGGPERVLTTYPLLVETLGRAAAAAAGAGAEAERELGALVARLAVLRRLCRQVAETLDEGRPPVQEAATLKYLGNAFERDVIELARGHLPADDAGPDSAFGQALLTSPGFALRGGAADVLLSIVARAEARA